MLEDAYLIDTVINFMIAGRGEFLSHFMFLFSDDTNPPLKTPRA